jgi:hypothetical protein
MAERAVRPIGPLLQPLEAAEGASPLARMTVEERSLVSWGTTSAPVYISRDFAANWYWTKHNDSEVFARHRRKRSWL